MQKSSTAETRRGLLLSLFILGLVAALVVLPYQFRSEAGGQKSSDNKGLIETTVSHDDGLQNYDIREDKKAIDKIAGFRQSQNRRRGAGRRRQSAFCRRRKSLETARSDFEGRIQLPTFARRKSSRPMSNRDAIF